MLFLGGALTTWSAEGLQWGHVFATTNPEPDGSGAPFQDSPAGVAVDGTGNVYVAATGYGIDSVADVIIYKLSPAGVTLWMRSYYLWAGGEECAVALALDGAGNPCVAAITEGPEHTQDILLLKYDPEGSLTGVAAFDFLGGRDEVTDMALDRQDNIYLAGSTRGTNGHSSALLLKYDSTTRFEWAAVYQGRARDHGANALAVDALGNAYVTGWMGASCSTNTSGERRCRTDVLTAKFDTTGRQVWGARHNGTPGRDDEGQAIVVDEAGQVYVAGMSEARGQRQDWVTLKYSNTGRLRWVARHHDGTTAGGATCVLLGTKGEVYVGGSRATVVKYSGAGRKVWETAAGVFGSALKALQFDAAGFLYCAGSETYPAGNPYFLMAQIDPQDGTVLWSGRTATESDRSENAVAAAVTPAGEVVVSGISRTSVKPDFDVATVKFQAAASWDLPRVNVTAVAPSAREGASGDAATATFALWRAGPTNQTLHVGFYVGGTAKYLLDYEPMPGLLGEGYGVLPIPAGATYALLQVRARRDRVSERTETVRVTIDGGSLSAGRYLRGESYGAVARILDN